MALACNAVLISVQKLCQCHGWCVLRSGGGLQDRRGGTGPRIIESLYFDTLLLEEVDSARNLTDAGYGVVTIPDESGFP